MAAPLLRAVAVALGLLAGAIGFLPLRLLLPEGVGATAVRGSIWAGEISDLSIGPMALGDVRVTTDALALLGGTRRLSVTTRDGRSRSVILMPSGEIRLVGP